MTSPPLPPSPSTGFFGRRRAAAAAKASGRSHFADLADRAARGDADALAALPGAAEEARQHWKAPQWRHQRLDVFTSAIRAAIHDDVLTADEHEHVEAVGVALGIDEWITASTIADPRPSDVLRVLNPDVWAEMIIARLNDGWLPRMGDADVTPILRRDEVAHAQSHVARVEIVTRREYRGDSGGVSVPLGFGVRYSVSDVRARPSSVSTTAEEVDQGSLTVTSQRSVFVGEKSTIEVPHDGLVSVNRYADGVRLSTTTRQSNLVFKIVQPPLRSKTVVAPPTVIAAIIASAVRQHRAT
jgi:hypothetical protein